MAEVIMEDAAPELEGLADAIDDLGEEGSGDFGDFMSSIEQSMLNMMKETAKAPETAMEHWQAFSAAVDWTETWIRCLLSFHLVLLTIVVLTRKNVNAQTVLFLFICALAFLSEHLNTYCAANWASFSKQNYFDKHGAFAGIMYAGPLLIIGLFQLLNFLALSSSALITAKRMELARKIKSDKTKAEPEAVVSGEEATSAAGKGKGKKGKAAQVAST